MFRLYSEMCHVLPLGHPAQSTLQTAESKLVSLGQNPDDGDVHKTMVGKRLPRHHSLLHHLQITSHQYLHPLRCKASKSSRNPSISELRARETMSVNLPIGSLLYNSFTNSMYTYVSLYYCTTVFLTIIGIIREESCIVTHK